jgi:hypothetical protein
MYLYPFRLYVDGRNTALRVLHDDVEHAFAVAHALLRFAAQIDRAEHGAVFGRTRSNCPARKVLYALVDERADMRDEDKTSGCPPRCDQVLCEGCFRTRT